MRQNSSKKLLFPIPFPKFLHHSLKQILFTLLLLLLIQCGVPKGEFGWTTTKMEEMDILEQHIQTITDYKMMRDDLIFSPTDTIHYVYQFSRNPGLETDFHISLNRYELDFVEIDIKKKRVEPDTLAIRDEFSLLRTGEYLIKIVYEGDTVDEVKFRVLPVEGYTQENLEQELAGDQTDEIIKYSR
ncbi:LIC_12238 family plasminogen-binding lipoprotein [Leptospira bouyouniensis]|uniref:Lipoprotein n=1 Tax=Leptospira bouyouniensis TaxID=2484911 RepID=A0A7I0HU07_9LEPT|nr:hypothetical protein [Leptospira bouyouniensis]TGK47306.1 hypothetical protein EHQ10_13735 [Leptospira bouyouniensis]TGL07412.1 hypothetical protein EHQ43_08115 [Leptospira bouyouniensis]TGM81111.1 hypothetical protein EHQ99_07280 [Leptospira bouyouniensis]